MACSVFSRKEIPSENRQSICSQARYRSCRWVHHLLLWSPVRFFDRRAHSPENLSSMIQKEFCNTISGVADIGRPHRPPSFLCGVRRGPPDRRGCFRMPAIVVALTRSFRSGQPFLHSSLTERLIVFQIDDGLIPDKGEIAVVAGERLDTCLASQNFAAQRKVNVLHAMQK